MTSELKTVIDEVFGSRTPGVSRAPGRVNLMGEHTDYNQGFVLPIAINRCADVYFAPRDDDRIRIKSMQLGDSVDVALADIKPDMGVKGWAFYTLGPIWALKSTGHELGGMDFVLESKVPMGSGLSSSAAVQVAVVGALNQAFDLKLDNWDIARTAQQAENEFAGVSCGILDPFASVFGEPKGALFLDCRSLEFEIVDIDFPEHRFLVVNTGVKHSLGESAYGERQRECRQGATQLGVGSLRDASEQHLAKLPDELIGRARHVISENLRVEHAVGALRRGDTDYFGELMFASHESLKEDYAVSCPELDLLVDACMDAVGCVGARLTGAGFGGCVVALVERTQEKSVRTALEQVYMHVFKRTPECIAITPGAGLTVEAVAEVSEV